MFLCAFSIYAQTQTKTWNQIRQRYEYFDSNRNLIGYETWNIVSKQWEYYDVRPATNNNYTPPPYVPPYSAETLILKAYMSSEQRTNNVMALANMIREVKISKENAGYMNNERRQFWNSYIDGFNNRVSDNKNRFYSDDNYYNSVIRWMEGVYNSISSWSKPLPIQSTVDRSKPWNYVKDGCVVYKKKKIGSKRIAILSEGVVEVIGKEESYFFKVKLPSGEIGYIYRSWFNL